MFGFGPIGDIERMVHYVDVFPAGNSEFVVEVMLRDDVPEWDWNIVCRGVVLGTFRAAGGEVTRCHIPSPGTSTIRIGIIPANWPIESMDYWYSQSNALIITWDPQDCDKFEIYHDGGLGGAVSTLAATVPGEKTMAVIDLPNSAATYVFNVIPVTNGTRAAAVNHATHEDVSRVIAAEVLPPTNIRITAVSYSAPNWTIRVEWTASGTGGATYEYQVKNGASPDTINPNGTWTPCTSPLDVVLTGSEDDLVFVHVRSTAGGTAGSGRTVHMRLPNTSYPLIPDESTIYIPNIRHDAGTLYLTPELVSTENWGNVTFDLDYATTPGGAYTTLSGWQAGVVGTLFNGNYTWRGEASVSGPTPGDVYYVRVRARSATRIGPWSEEVPYNFTGTPALAAVFNDIRGG